MSTLGWLVPHTHRFWCFPRAVSASERGDPAWWCRETVTLRSAEVFQPRSSCGIKLPNFQIFLLMKPPLVFSIKPVLILRLSALRSPLEPCSAKTAPVIKLCHLDLGHFLPLEVPVPCLLQAGASTLAVCRMLLLQLYLGGKKGV